MRVETSILGRMLRYRSITATTPDKVSIAIQDHDRGVGGRDVLFVHGYSQSSLAWLKQVTGPLAERHRLVTYDMRGHGASDKPTDPAFYREPWRWSGELQAVIDAAGLDRPVIVTWSYAGRVVLDFFAERGVERVGGVVKVASTSTDKAGVAGPAAPHLRALALATELADNIVATRTLLSNCVAQPLPPEEAEVMLAYNLLVPPYVRAAMGGRPAQYDAVLEKLAMPILTVHGALDRINLPAMSEHTSGAAAQVRSLLYEESGHMPFWEEPDRFNRDMEEFLADTVASGRW